MRVFAYSRRERAFLISVASLVLLLSSIGVVAPLRAPMATWGGGAVASAAAAEAAPTAEPGAKPLDPSRPEAIDQTSTTVTSVTHQKSEISSPSILLDLNQATLAELTALPGIGPTLAGRIIEYRESHGGFRRVHDLLHVKGIGEARFERLYPLVTVSSSSQAGT